MNSEQKREVPVRGGTGTWPGSPARTAGRTAGTETPPGGGRLRRLPPTSGRRLRRRGDPGGGRPAELDRVDQGEACGHHEVQGLHYIH